MTTLDDELMAEAGRVATAAPIVAPPWPRVGCVIVRDGEIVGRGATGAHPVGPHAEVGALAEAGDRARGATAYTTLEPCDHDGNTPPCTKALIDAGVIRVVMAIVDPDAKVAGRGIERLRGAGIDVEIGPGEAAAEAQLAPYLHHRRTGRAFALLKTAMSLDGRTSAADGTSQWITGAAARADVHRLRAESQAIVVGPATALKDRPTLTARDVPLAPWRQPLRVLLDARGRVPVEGPLADSSLAPTLVVATERADDATLAAWRTAGAVVAVVGSGPDGRGVDLAATLALLGRDHGVHQVLIEGGGKLHGAFVAEGLANRLVTYVAPVVLGERGRAVIAYPGADTLEAAPRWRVVDVTEFAPDVRITYTRDPRAGRTGLMFTGIVEELGRVRAISANAGGARLVIDARTVIEDARIGDSIAVNGCCLTVVELDDQGWTADAVTETLDRTSLGSLTPGSPLNLERPVRVSDRLGGHIVQGHVDGVGTLQRREPLPDGSTRMQFAVPADLLRYVVEKGSITLDGISLTVAALDDAGGTVDIAVIPHTLSVTTLGPKQPGDPVNIEVDILAKHVERLLSARE